MQIQKLQKYISMITTCVYSIEIHYIPMNADQIALKNFIATKGIRRSPWLGFDHFIRFFDSYYFWRLLKNTIILSGYQLILFPLPIILALSLHEVRNGVFKKWA